jgi:pimeloyl-ACP methyl ester carboxylesterase
VVPSPARRRVVFLPGGVTPVAPSYAPLLEELGDEIDPVLKDLEVYEADEPPADYSMALEVDGLRRVADGAGLERFHLVAYSGGGAVALAFAARYPERLTSLALFEPANLPGRWDDDERASDRRLADAMAGLPPDQMLAAFTRGHLREGVEPPPTPPGAPPAWMAKRPAGLNAMMRAFAADDTDREAFRACRFPVYYAYGLLTAEYIVHRAQILAGLLPDLWIEAYPDVHHFGPPQRTQPARYADSLRQLWARAERAAAAHQGGDPTFAA